MNELVLKEDINKVAELNSNALNTVVAQMTSLANAIVSDRDDIDSMVESLEKQAWYKRMWNTLTGKNKAAKEEIAQKKDQMTGYIIQSVSSLYEMGKISQDMVVSLGQKINDIYYQVSLNSFETLAAKEAIVQLRGMVGKIANELNAKIESVDNFNILNKQIEQGVYGNEKAVSAICRVLSNMDNRMLSDQRKVDIIGRSMETAGIINDAETAITDIMADIAEVTDDKIGEVYLELSSMSGNFWAGLFSQVMERYTMLPKMERMAKKKDVIIRNILEKNDIDESASFSTHDLYRSFIESRQEMAEMVSKVRIEDSSSNSNTEQKADLTATFTDAQRIIDNGEKCIQVEECQQEDYGELNNKTISKIIEDVFGKSKKINANDFYNKLVVDNSESAAKLLSIIHAEMIFDRDEDYDYDDYDDEDDEYDNFRECLEELYNQYLDSIDMKLFYALSDFLFSSCEDQLISVNDLYDLLIKDREFSCWNIDTNLHHPISEEPVVISRKNVERDYDSPPMSGYLGNACDISLRNIEIEYGTRRIGKNAFCEHRNIAKIIIPDTVEEIDDGAFENSCCNAVIIIPGSIKKCSLNAFEYCWARKIIVSEGMTELDSNGVVLSYVMAREIILPNSLRNIGYGGLESCSHVKTIDFRNVSPFDIRLSDCSLLENVIFRADIESFMEPSLPRNYFFQNCPKLKNIYFPQWYNREYVDLIIKGICRDNKDKIPSDFEIRYY